MSVIHVNQIANKMKSIFDGKIDMSDTSPKDPELETKFLTRALAAYAVLCVAGANDVDAAGSVTDGGDDNGIDAIYYSLSNKRMTIVQSKWSKKGLGEPDSGDVRKFKDGIKDLLNLQFDRFNNKTKKLQPQILAGLNAFDTKFNIILIHTGNKNLSTHSERVIGDLISELNDAGDGSSDEIVTFHQLNQARVHSSLADGIEGDPINIDIGLSQWGKLDEPSQAFFGVVDGAQVFNWFSSHGNRLFSKNIRQILGATDVNEEIKLTIENTPDKFWYYNNGITIIADSVKKSMVGGNGKEAGIFQAKNISIVNGAQTVGTIGNMQGIELGSVKVQLKLISLENSDEGFGVSITKANNRQNRIENRDFVSLDEQQLRIRTELAIEGVDYNIVRSDTFKATDKSFDLIEATVSLACASGQSNLAVQAKREIGKFYENTSKSPYKTIFNPNTSGVYVFNVVKCLRIIDRLIDGKISELEKKNGREYGVLIHGNRMIALIVFSKLNIGNDAQNYEFEMNESSIIPVFSDVINKLEDVLNKKYPEKVLGTLFKNATICKDIYSEVMTME
ncbi:AIPR family protein [Proteus mirabilis]|uniref:AIPR family protein n=1 Tax=Proteus mirabilis TaxID=584 RepID=UPI000D14486F|nr:AIPR family protein [Proteus mirabilis]MDM3591667.1 AIPR family protein [Proteus mirabilis]HEK1040069.1 AIPR family protein [Proteus mirabilis]